MDIRFIGHACFEISDGSTNVLVDPFLAPNNPAATIGPDDVSPTVVVVTHGHADHIADAAGVAKKSGAKAIAIVEVANWLGSRGVEDVSDPNLGGTVEFDGGWVKLVQAFHTNTMPGSSDEPFSAEHGVPVGQAAGAVINVGGTTVYHLGDTCLFGDLALIAKSTPVDVALIPIGGHYTMDRHDAVTAAELIGAKTVIPMHYDTFPPIETDAEAFKSEVESKTSSKVVILKPGETHSE
jgi:L-ascorbate metabolism protein UlaG (beta-lactamase superfamily)